MTVSDIIEKRNAKIAEIKSRYWEKRQRLLLECQWEIDEVGREFDRELRGERIAA